MEVGLRKRASRGQKVQQPSPHYAEATAPDAGADVAENKDAAAAAAVGGGVVSRSVAYGVAILIHLCLIIFGTWQDANFEVKYTDVDYEVFTDAARHVAVDFGSPYMRHTYRYTPLLAYVLTPNIFISKLFGKILFSALDILVGITLESLLTLKGCPKSQRETLLLLWLWNPLTIQVSTRGNADSLPVLFVVLTLLTLRQRRWVLSGLLFGFAVHLKIFPIVMGLPCLLFINPNYIPRQPFLPRLLSPLTSLIRPQLAFIVSALSVFFGLIAFFYALYGWDFLFQSYLYHLVRVDHRHNFSPFFYLLYLTQLMPEYRRFLSLTTFLSQWIPVLFVGCQFARLDIESAVFLQLLIFVAFNKVCTVQYFLWWMGLLPLIADYCIRFPTDRQQKSKSSSSKFWKSTLLYFVVWLVCQGIWLYCGYQLEFVGRPAFLQIWISGLLFFFSGVALIIHFLQHLKRSTPKIE